MKSLWMDETEIQDFSMLMQDITVDVAVVGGGMAGILTAYLLKEQGVHVACLLYTSKSGRVVRAVGAILDIDAEKRKAQNLMERAQRDMLTKLYLSLIHI